VTTATAAPSFWPLALPAVTVASGSSLPMMGRSSASVSTLESGRMCSSRSTTVSLFRPLTVIGTISSANFPDSAAAAARWWLRTAYSSCSSREILYSRRRFSAVSSMPPGTGWCRPPAVIRPRARPSWSSTPGPALTPQRIAVE
jgi:hypothetical protein